MTSKLIMTDERIGDVIKMAQEAAKIYGGEWDSALIAENPGNNVHGIVSDHIESVVVRADDDSLHSSWVCDYLESVSPAFVIAALYELQERRKAAMDSELVVPVVPEEMTPEMMLAVQLNSELGAYAVSNLSGAYDLFAEFWKVACRAAMLQAGNSPVIPESCSAQFGNFQHYWHSKGYVMVPKEPTEAMCDISHIGVDVYCGITDDNEYYSIGGAEAAKVWKAMLAAAPQLPGSEPATVPGKWIPVSERMPPPRYEVLVGRWWGEKPRWCCKWATYIPGHPDSQSSGWLIPGASWTPTHWMPLPAAPQEVKS